jgi:hypothetical protein
VNKLLKDPNRHAARWLIVGFPAQCVIYLEETWNERCTHIPHEVLKVPKSPPNSLLSDDSISRRFNVKVSKSRPSGDILFTRDLLVEPEMNDSIESELHIK